MTKASSLHLAGVKDMFVRLGPYNNRGPDFVIPEFYFPSTGTGVGQF